MKLQVGLMCSLMAVTLSFAGCGKSGESGLALIPAAGSLMLDGKAAGGVALTVLPQAGTTGKVGYGVTESDGQFTLQISPTEKGVAAGKYQVLLSKYTMPDGSPIPEGTSAADVGAKNALPRRYSDPSTSDVYVDFPPADGKPLVIGIKSKGK